MKLGTSSFAITVLTALLAACGSDAKDGGASSGGTSASAGGGGGAPTGSGNGGALGSGGATSGAGGASTGSGSGGTTLDASAAGGGGRGGSLGSGGTSGSNGGAEGGPTASDAGDSSTGTIGGRDGGASAFKLTSPMLSDGAMIPADSTCETTKSSSQMPELDWSGAPPGTKSFAMVFVDTTLIGMTPPNANGFHSAMWDIPANTTMLPYGIPAGSPPAGVAGLESVKQKKAPSGMAWLGPCPNFGSTIRTKTDTYEFRLYALSQEMLPSNFSSMTIQQIMNAVEALPPLGKAVLGGTSNAAGTMLK